MKCVVVNLDHGAPTLMDCIDKMMHAGLRVELYSDGKPVAFLVPACDAPLIELLAAIERPWGVAE